MASACMDVLKTPTGLPLVNGRSAIDIIPLHARKKLERHIRRFNATPTSLAALVKENYGCILKSAHYVTCVTQGFVL